MQEHQHTYANVPPFLERLSSAAWYKFLFEYEAYQARGGIRPIKNLMSTAVLRLISIRLTDVNDLEGSDLCDKISALFAPKTALESYDRFKKVSMTSKTVSVDAVLNFILSFEKEELLCEASLPSDKQLRKLFIGNLKPSRLSERVLFREPESLEESKRFAIEEAENLAHWTKELDVANAPEERNAPKVFSKKPFAGKQDENPVAAVPPIFSKPPVCHECGETGHIRPNCPKRQNMTPKPKSAVAGQSKAVKMQLQENSVGVPRLPMRLSGLLGSMPVSALLDTGSSLCLISRQSFSSLIRLGVAVREISKTITVADKGSVTLDKEIECFLEVDQGPGIPLALKTKITCQVLDTDEDLIVGFGFLQETGLIQILTGDHFSDGNRKVVDEPGDLTTNEENLEADTVSISFVEDPVLQRDIQNLCSEFPDVFNEHSLSEPARVPPMDIVLKTNQFPRSVPPRRMSPAMRQVVDSSVQSLLAQGIIRPSMSSVASPVVVVRREGKDPRMCVDYREVNACTVDLQFPMQNTHSILERMSGMKYFGVMDLRSGFHQLPLTESAIPFTAFCTPAGLYEYTRIPFGLKNAPRYFQKIMMDVLAGLVGTICEVFVDDICIYASTQEMFMTRLRTVLERLRQFGLRVKAEKCRLGLSEVVYLGHVVSGQGLKISPERQKVVRRMTAPTTKAELRSFIGLANYMRCFVRNFASLISPLTALCSERAVFEWNAACESGFAAIKEAILTAPLLHHLDYTKQIILRTDASQVGVGGMLLQQTDEGERPVWFLSRKFTPTEAKWSTIEQEAYAIFYCVTQLSHLLLGHRFIVETDHRNLIYLHQSATPKLVRWRLRLQEFDFSIVHIPGDSNCVSDVLSRCLTISEDVIPVIQSVHNPVVGHRGLKQTKQLLEDSGKKWDNMEKDIAAFISSCATCQKVVSGKASYEASLRSTMVSEPFDTLAIDTVGPLPVDEAGHKYLIVAIDAFSRFVELRSAPDCTAKEAARLILDIVGRYGAPRVIRSDNGSQYSAQIVEELLKLLGCGRHFTIPYRPQSNGIVERVNGEVMRHLRALVMDLRMHGRWSEVIPLVQRIINSSYHSSVGTYPSRIVFGDRISLNRHILPPKGGEEQTETVVVEDYIQNLVKVQADICKNAVAFQNGIIQKRLKQNEKMEHVTPEVGDHVLIDYPERPPTKISPHWRGPSVVVAVEGSSVSCQDLLTNEVKKYHLNRLKWYDASRTTSALEIAEIDKDEWLVEAIVGHQAPAKSNRKKSKKDWKFRVRWEGFGPDEDSWLGYSEVRDLKALDEYLTAHPAIGL
eukprot:ANDGO_01040.mRNA.1 Retrovirus-related Pol polyprotein from transposon 17.6